MPIQIPKIHPGTLPGTLVSPSKASITRSRAFVYNEHQVIEKDLADILNGTYHLLESESLWISVVGLQDLELIKSIGTFFHLHPLALEDVLGSHQRPKIDVYDHYEFIVVKLVHLEPKLKLLRQQLSIFLGDNFVISFLESPSDILTLTERNLQNPQSKLAQGNVDGLAYQLMDIVIDSYFSVISAYSDALDEFEMNILRASATEFVRDLQRVKSDLRILKLYTWSHRDLLNVIIRNDQNIIRPAEVIYFRDCYDHAIQQLDILESLRETAMSLLDIYLSTIANRLNQVMKTLTVISIMFMPPTFLAAVWGMNFHDMPEIQWPHGYVFAWASMLVSSGLAVLFVWYYGWLRTNKN